MQPCACVRPRLLPGYLSLQSGFHGPGPALPATPLPFTLFTRTPPALFRGPLHSSSQSLPDGRACWRLYYAAALNKHLYYILCSVPCRFPSFPAVVPRRSISFRAPSAFSLLCYFLSFFFCHSPRKWPSLLVIVAATLSLLLPFLLLLLAAQKLNLKLK